jgi:hypothetical protein
MQRAGSWQSNSHRDAAGRRGLYRGFEGPGVARCLDDEVGADAKFFGFTGRVRFCCPSSPRGDQVCPGSRRCR